MFPIVSARPLGAGIKEFVIAAPRIARKQRPGQFVIVRLTDHGERIPLTIKDSDPEQGTITLVVQAIGKTTHQMNSLDAGDGLLDVVGPLGKASEIRLFGNVVVVGGGVGAAIALPTARALRDAGNHVASILGARSRDLIVLEDQIRDASTETFVMTDDGSRGEKGLVTHKLSELIASREIHFVLAIGPIPMMRAVAEVTRPKRIETVVSLNSIMVDGTGMCGGCRVVVGGKSQFACVDGPEFDAHQVDFDVMMRRNSMYRMQEQLALQRYLDKAKS